MREAAQLLLKEKKADRTVLHKNIAPVSVSLLVLLGYSCSRWL